MSSVEALPLWSVVDRSLFLDYGRLQLVEEDADGDGTAATEAVQAEVEGAAWFTSGNGWVALASHGSSHFPTVELQAWDEEPPAQAHRWGSQEELAVTFASEVVQLWGTTDPSQGPTMQLPHSEDGRYRLRVFRDGDTAAQKVEDLIVEAGGTGRAVRDAERWLFQFWSA